MSELTPNALHAELRALIANSRQRLADQLAQGFGRGFEAKNLRRMVQFAQAFRAINADRYMVDLIRHMPKPPWKSEPHNLGKNDACVGSTPTAFW